MFFDLIKYGWLYFKTCVSVGLIWGVPEEADPKSMDEMIQLHRRKEWEKLQQIRSKYTKTVQ